MGAEGSKGNNSNTVSKSSHSDSRCQWLTNAELLAVGARVDASAKENGGKYNLAPLNAIVSEHLNSSLCQLFQSLVCTWKGRTLSADNISPVEAKKIFIELLNPSTDTQLEILSRLCEGKEGLIPSSNLVECVSAFTRGYCRLTDSKLGAGRTTDDVDSYRAVAKAWLQEVLYDGATFKKSQGKDPHETIPSGAVNTWLKGHSSVYLVIQLSVMRRMLCQDLNFVKELFPKVTIPKSISLPLSPPQMLLLNTSLPPLLRCEWRLLFSNTCHGDSFSLLMKHITNAGPSLILIEDEDSNLFGGFASANWEVRPQFHGTAESFLFSLRPQAGVYHTTGYNSNYMYLNFLRDNTMPNGLGMGGREELFGFFLSSDFGECTVAPNCTTFDSPPICPNLNPKVKYVTVWGVGEEPVDSDEDEDAGPSKSRSALDKNVEARAMLDMIGRGRASDGLREPEPDED